MSSTHPSVDESTDNHMTAGPDRGRSEAEKPTVRVAVCTFNRNGPLERLLRALLANAERLGERTRIGVVVVDDSSAGGARNVVERFEGEFELGVTYLHSDRQNISIARNLAVNAASRIADWVAMTDDDCEPVDCWIEALLEMQQRTDADAVCGLYRRRTPEAASKWLTDEPFLEIGLGDHENGTALSMAGTNNSMISSRWWAAHPDIRFKPELGITGGEDMVFYRTAHAAGLRIVFARRAAVFKNEPASRTTLSYQLRLFFWVGNSSYVTRREMASDEPHRIILQAGNHLRMALFRPIGRMWHRETPQLRYSLALTLYAFGLMTGLLGIRVSHR